MWKFSKSDINQIEDYFVAVLYLRVITVAATNCDYEILYIYINAGILQLLTNETKSKHM